MDYVVMLTIEDSLLDGVWDIDLACHLANERLGFMDEGTPPFIRPLSEVIAC